MYRSVCRQVHFPTRHKRRSKNFLSAVTLKEHVDTNDTESRLQRTEQQAHDGQCERAISTDAGRVTVRVASTNLGPASSWLRRSFSVWC
jgi:hypothetical protein